MDFPEYGAEGYVHLLNQTEWNHIPTVIHLHGPLVMLAHTIGWPDLDSEFYRVGTEMEHTCLRLADAVFTSSRTSAEWCARQYGLDVAHVPVIHTGVDVDALPAPGRAEGSAADRHFRGQDRAKQGRRTFGGGCLSRGCRLPWPARPHVGAGRRQIDGEAAGESGCLRPS